MGSSAAFEPLNSKLIREALQTVSLGRTIHLVQKTSSTNITALSLAKDGNPHGTVVLAECQTAGRGRHGRTWFSPPGKNMYCSILLLKDEGNEEAIQRVSWVPLMTGVATARALRRQTGLSIALKWPNDLMINHKKLGGILCERVGLSPSQWGLVVGIGINVNMVLKEFPPELRGTSTSLQIETGEPFNRNLLVATLMNELEGFMNDTFSKPTPDLIQEYTSLCTTIGAHVRVETGPGNTVDGLAVGIGEDGSLHVSRLPSQEGGDPPTPFIIQSGDVFHVRERSEAPLLPP